MTVKELARNLVGALHEVGWRPRTGTGTLPVVRILVQYNVQMEWFLRDLIDKT